MKTRTYESREAFEKLHPYVSVEAPYYQGQKASPAQIVESFTSMEVAENNSKGGLLMTRKQAEKFIQKWNAEYEAGNYNL